MKKIPKKFNDYLGSYGQQFYDSHCGECINWGYRINKYLGGELWAELSEFGDFECDHISGTWYLITKKLTIKEAIKQYGSVTAIFTGPRGGFKGVKFGDTQFCFRELDPREINGMEKFIEIV